MMFKLPNSVFCVFTAFNTLACATFRDEASNGTTFLLFTRNNPHTPTELLPYDDTTIGNYNPDNDNKITIHGYGSNRNKTWMNEIKDAFLDKEDVNVIIVDWGPLAAGPLYPVAVANTRIVGEYVGTLVTYLVSLGSTLERTHILGHSLGAQTAGFAGASLGGQVGRITGLDPAGPLYLNVSPEGRLDPSDAVFVEVLHTNAGDIAYGVPFNCGHIDFWPNGGSTQAGCYDPFESIPNFEIDCSHERAPIYYVESVKRTNAFVSYPCSNYSSYSAGDCTACGPDGCPNMGYDTRPGQTGVYYLATRITEPFSGKHVFVDLKISETQQPATGRIFLALNSTSGSDLEEVITEGGNNKINPGATFNSVIAVLNNLQNFDGGSVGFDQEGTEPPTSLLIDSIEVWDPETNQRICSETDLVIADGGSTSVTFVNC